MKIVFQNENVTLWHGDCREAMAAMPAESVDLLWTDPPYGHGNNDGDLAAARVGVAGARQRPVDTIANDGAEEMRAVVDAMLTESARVLKRDCCCCCCCGGGGPRPTFAWVAQRMDSGGLTFFHSVIWDKTARGPGLGWRYRRDHEMLMIAHRSGGRLRWADPDKAVSNIVRTMPPREREHPNEKPSVSDTPTGQAVQSDALLAVLRAVAKRAKARRELLLTMGPMTTERADALYDLACCLDEVITDLSSNPSRQPPAPWRG